jgi:hypothetical protein
LAATRNVIDALPCPEAGATCEIQGAPPFEAVHVQSGVVVTSIAPAPPSDSIAIGADGRDTWHLTGVGPDATSEVSHPATMVPSARAVVSQSRGGRRIGHPAALPAARTLAALHPPRQFAPAMIGVNP